MSGVTCPQGHPLPGDYNHGLDNRQPCPVCGSRGRVFHREAFDGIPITDTATAHLELRAGADSIPISDTPAGAHLTLSAGPAGVARAAGGSDRLILTTPDGDEVPTEILESYRITMERVLDEHPVRIVNVWDGAGNIIGAQVCETADDLGLAIAMLIAEDLSES